MEHIDIIEGIHRYHLRKIENVDRHKQTGVFNVRIIQLV